MLRLAVFLSTLYSSEIPINLVTPVIINQAPIIIFKNVSITLDNSTTNNPIAIDIIPVFNLTLSSIFNWFFNWIYFITL